MQSAAVILSLIAGVLAALHLLWALGYWWPIRDEATLAQAVVGTRHVSRMPGAVPSALVAVALIGVAWLPWWEASGLRSWAMLGIAAVFLARALASRLPAWRRRFPTDPFAVLDRRLYGPLCLILAVLSLLVWWG